MDRRYCVSFARQTRKMTRAFFLLSVHGQIHRVRRIMIRETTQARVFVLRYQFPTIKNQ